jgi:hypothetical protein
MPDDTTAPVTAETDCPSCDTCGSMPCNGGCRTGEWAGEERHVCADEDACRAVFNREPGAFVSAEGLRERLIARLLESWSVAEDGTSARMARITAGRNVDVVLAELAGDPGDLPARMAARLERACTHFADDPECAEMTAAALMDERWEHAAHIAARLAQAETRAEHAEAGAQISAERLAKVQRERDAKLRTKALGRSLVELEGFAQRETARADAAEGQVERLRAELTRYAAFRDEVLGNLSDVMRARHEERAERDALKAAIEEVRQQLAKIAHLAEFSPEAKVAEVLPLVKRLIAILESARSPGDAEEATDE